jgi:hypothetical protein
MLEAVNPTLLLPAPFTLTTEEKTRLHQLERVVEKNLHGFLETGRALAEIRSSRLYRERYPTFESYVRERWALSRSRADELCRSTATAQLLIDNGVQLPADTSEAVIRPVASLPSPELQTASWRLIEAVSPACGPTQPIAAKVCRTIKNALEPNGTGGNGHKPRKQEHPSRERPFIQAAQRLSAYEGFDAGIVTSHIEKFPSACNVYTACSNLIKRCEAVMHSLENRFPELSHG